MKTIKIIGGGLAGTECAWQLARGLAYNKLHDYYQIFLRLGYLKGFDEY